MRDSSSDIIFCLPVAIFFFFFVVVVVVVSVVVVLFENRKKVSTSVHLQWSNESSRVQGNIVRPSIMFSIEELRMFSFRISSS